MCTRGKVLPGDMRPGDMAQALRMLDAALDYVNGPLFGQLSGEPAAGAQGEALVALGRASAKLAAARARVLSRFDADRGYHADGYGSSRAWLAARTGVTQRAAGAEVRRMRQLRRHPVIAQGLARGEVSESWAEAMAEWTRKLPPALREGVDKLLTDTAAAGASLEDLAIVARTAYERWRAQQPGPDGGDDGFEDRYLKLGTTIDNAGRITGDLTPECTAAVQAVLEALGKKRGPEDARTEPQRFHDALQEACELLIRADMVPDRAGADTRVEAVISLGELLALPGAGELQEAWLGALAGQHGYLAGAGAEAAACDAIVSPVVTGHLDLAVVDQMIDVILACLDTADRDAADNEANGSGTTADGSATTQSGRPMAARPLPPQAPSPKALPWLAVSPEAWQAVRYAIARLAVDLVSGPGGLAATLRQGLLPPPHNSRPVILDIGYSSQIPGAIRRAVALRARHCEWPGCRRRPAACDVHHLRHKSDGGETSVRSCVLLCQFHHDVCIHRWGWSLVLHPDGATTAHGPRGQVLRSHGPPAGEGPAGGGRLPGGGEPAEHNGGPAEYGGGPPVGGRPAEYGGGPPVIGGGPPEGSRLTESSGPPGSGAV